MKQYDIGELQDIRSGVDSERSVLKSIESQNINREKFSAWPEFRPTLEKIITELPARSVLEIGGGRQPFFSFEEAERRGFKLSISDIDKREMDLAAIGESGLVFDIAKDSDVVSKFSNHFDLVFSRMVFEHIKDSRKAWSNVHTLLKPGGIGFAFVPTLHSPPFVINKLLPDSLSSKILLMINAERNPSGVPKFPAYYHSCRASEKSLAPFLKDIGFKEVCVIPFYGTPYFAGIPVVNIVTKFCDNIIQHYDWRAFASYAYIMARK